MKPQIKNNYNDGLKGVNYNEDNLKINHSDNDLKKNESIMEILANNPQVRFNILIHLLE